MQKLSNIFGFIVFVCFTAYLTWFISVGILGSLRDGSQKHQAFTGELDFELKSQLKSLLKCRDTPLITKMLQHGNYWLLKNLIRGRRSKDMECSESITYTTSGDYTFMGHLVTVVKRWLGPISFALFAPGYDFNDTMEAIQYARHCLPESQLIRDYVSFHIFFPNEHLPYEQVPRTEEEALKWPYDCPSENVPYDNVAPSFLYRSKVKLTYPINVGRNIARKAANTHFILASDIELYPSLGLIHQFLHMAANNVSLVSGGNTSRVFPLPVFEVHHSAAVPATKAQLLAMLKKKKAVPLHERHCKLCNFVPELGKWIKSKPSGALEVLTVAKRQGKYVYWEPFYVSDNNEPEFDERVSAESQLGKRMQNYAMCLLHYEYHILHPAFLVHSSGPKKPDPNSQRFRFLNPVSDFIEHELVPGYSTLYGVNKKCLV